jgi:hypothetical protein
MPGKFTDPGLLERPTSLADKQMVEENKFGAQLCQIQFLFLCILAS